MGKNVHRGGCCIFLPHRSWLKSSFLSLCSTPRALLPYDGSVISSLFLLIVICVSFYSTMNSTRSYNASSCDTSATDKIEPRHPSSSTTNNNNGPQSLASFFRADRRPLTLPCRRSVYLSVCCRKRPHPKGPMWSNGAQGAAATRSRRERRQGRARSTERCSARSRESQERGRARTQEDTGWNFTK